VLPDLSAIRRDVKHETIESRTGRVLQDEAAAWTEILELDRLHNETRKLVAERQKLLAEEKKLKWETYFYPVAVVAGVLTASAALAGVFFRF
jgi:hypothetical protein